MNDDRTPSPWVEPDVTAVVRQRQRARARVMGLLLGGLVLLIFLVAMAKIKAALR